LSATHSLDLIHRLASRSAADKPERGEKNKMKNMKQLLVNLVNEDSGQDLIEYALVAALVGLGAVASMKTLSNSIGTAFTGVGTALTAA
jgi:pilus assembly protein Flp/PilA